MAIQGSTNRPTIHEKFSNTINTIQGLCQKLNGKTVTGLQKNICKGIIGLCEKYNNSIHSLQGHDRRVVARAYLSYKKKQTGGSLNDSKVNIFGQRVNKGTINNTDFDQKALNLNFVKTLQGKDLKAFSALFKNDESIRNSFVKQNRDELLNSDNKTIFNSLPMKTQKAFIEQNKGDIDILSTFSNVYKEELIKPENNALFRILPTEVKKAFVQSQITVNKEQLQSILQSCDNGSTTSNTQSTFIKLLSKETLNANDTKFIEENQVFKDLKRGYQFEFIAQNGEKIEIKNNKENTQPLSYVEIFQEIQKQVKKTNLTEKDKEVLADFLANHVAQGVFATCYQDPNIVAKQCLHWEGNNLPLFIIEHKNNQTSVTVKTEGDGTHTYVIHDAPCKINIETKAEVVFTYPKSIGECKCKASSIEVKRFEQQIGDVTIY